jgi:osmotically-inducible protein OsmY
MKYNRGYKIERKEIMARFDEDIKKDVVDQLYWDNRVNAADVSVEVLNGEATLSGTVNSISNRLAAVSDAWTIEGVTSVINNLDISYQASISLPTDEQIKNRAENALLWNVHVLSSDMDVEVSNGLLTLKGTVDSYWKKLEAERTVSDLYGVISVENHLAIVPSRNFVDKEIASDIERAMERNLYLDPESLNVRVENGNVTLSGEVMTHYARTEAEQVARYTAGVKEVYNLVIVAEPVRA